MKNDLSDAVGPGTFQGLTVTKGGQFSRFRVDGAGKQLVKGAVEDESVCVFHFFAHSPVCLFQIGIQIDGSAEFGDFKAQAVFPRQLFRLRVDGGQVPVLSFHILFLRCAKRSSPVNSRPRGSRQRTP